MYLPTTKPRKVSKKPLQKVQGQQYSALGHSLALRMAGSALKGLIILSHTPGTRKSMLNMGECLRLNNLEREEE